MEELNMMKLTENNCKQRRISKKGVKLAAVTGIVENCQKKLETGGRKI
jgi:hypothetical protein